MVMFLQISTTYASCALARKNDWWCGWAARSRLSPFRHLAKTVRQHWDGILAYFDTQTTPAAIEAVNGVIQLAKRMAHGFKNFAFFKTAGYHRAGQLKLAVPTIT
jgi:transposase